MSSILVEKEVSSGLPLPRASGTVVTLDPRQATSSGREDRLVAIGSRDHIGTERRKARTVVRRKLRGVVLQFEGDRARVVFEENGKKFHYAFPASRLERSGITVENQPFEMIESETEGASGPIFSVKFEPMAEASSAAVTPLPLSEELRRKRQDILHHYAQLRGDAQA